MPKLKDPPQGGERRLCLTLFCTMFMAVLSAVVVIYSTVIIYLPSIKVLNANFIGPKMCTTLATKRELSGPDQCENWWSCEEWCLSKSQKSCSHVYAAVRELGTQIYWDGCEMDSEGFIDHTCNVSEDEPELNCKYFSNDIFESKGDKEKCIAFDEDVIQCASGICKNVSQVYKCEYVSKLDDLVAENECHCNDCQLKIEEGSMNNSHQHYGGYCPNNFDLCFDQQLVQNNETIDNMCKKKGCWTCKDLCHERGECFDFGSRRDPPLIGTDEYGLPRSTYYICRKGYCSEIYDLKCQRKCDSRIFETVGKNSVLFIGERVIMARCAKRSTAMVASIDNGKIIQPNQLMLTRTSYGERSKTLVVACTNVTIDKESGSMISQDCVNGTWLSDGFNGGLTNYSELTKSYWRHRDVEEFRVRAIDYEPDITIYPQTKLKINMEGCDNTLSKQCTAFYKNYGNDGRNYTARSVYQCFFDPANSDYAVIYFDPERSLVLLLIFLLIPGGIMLISCAYMCFCSKSIEVSDDGHMRLKCCGKFVTGIGNVPKWEDPRKVHLQQPLVGEVQT